jgi:hypothetical protein
MKLLIHIFSIIILIFLFTCCKNEENGPTSPTPIKTTNILVPLSVDNYWVYLTQSLDSTGLVWSQRYDTVSVTKDTLVNGESWYYVFDIICGYGWFTNRQDGYWFQSGDWITLKYPYPCNAGDSVLLSNGAIINIQSVKDTVYCSAGQFICSRYRDKSNHTYKFSPNVGRIYYEASYISPYTNKEYVSIRQILTSYKIK